MRRRTRQTLAALLSLVLLLCLAPVSFAADAIDLTKPNTVKINLVKGIPEFEGDIETALIQADFYLLAKAKPVTIDGVTYDTYEYEKLPTAFSSLQKTLDEALKDDPDPEKMNNGEAMLTEFTPLAYSFADIILSDSYSGAPQKTAVQAVQSSDINANPSKEIVADNLEAGLYLLVLRGSNLTGKTLKIGNENYGYVTQTEKKLSDNGPGANDSTSTKDKKVEKHIATRAFSEKYEYLFEPQLITVPTRVDESGQQQVNTAFGTAWSYELKVNIKATRQERTGKLKVTKTLSSYVDLSTEDGKTTYYEPATFTFDIIGRKTKEVKDPVIFRRQVTIHFTDPGTLESEIVKGIPVGTWIWVTEEYQGAHYTGSPTCKFPIEIKGDKISVENGKTVVAEEVANATFSNSDDTTHRGGHGIENVFTYGDNGWVFSTNPGGEHTKDDLNENGKVVVTS